jgi:hypothetical protein
MKKLYIPKNPMELSLIKSIFDSEGISYHIQNEQFGSLNIGPQIEMFNSRIIMVQDEDFEKAGELLSDFLSNNEEKPEISYSLFDKIRMIIETILFGWFVSGKK